MRWTLVLTWHPDTPHADRVTLLSQIRALAGHGIVRVRGGLHLPGSVGPGHATVHLLLQHRRPPSADSALAALLTNPDAGIASAVAYPARRRGPTPLTTPSTHPKSSTYRATTCVTRTT